MLARLFTIQAAWSYELMIGPGTAYCAEPALRRLGVGTDATAYHEALAREGQFFNAHPYLAAVAVGALARAELDHEPPPRIARFRAALCGPLGSVGDRLVWAGWLPASALLALLAFALGASALVIVVLFLVVYNAGHLSLRAWGLDIGWREGLHVATALGQPALRRGPAYLARAVLVLAGLAVPLAAARVLMAPLWEAPVAPGARAAVVAAGVAVAALLTLLRGRVDGWRVALVALGLLVLTSLVRP